jgi:hypothetical protein
MRADPEERWPPAVLRGFEVPLLGQVIATRGRAWCESSRRQKTDVETPPANLRGFGVPLEDLKDHEETPPPANLRGFGVPLEDMQTTKNKDEKGKHGAGPRAGTHGPLGRVSVLFGVGEVSAVAVTCVRRRWVSSGGGNDSPPGFATGNRCHLCVGCGFLWFQGEPHGTRVRVHVYPCSLLLRTNPELDPFVGGVKVNT